MIIAVKGCWCWSKMLMVKGGERETELEEEILKKVDVGLGVGGGVGQETASSPAMATSAPTSPTWRVSTQ